VTNYRSWLALAVLAAFATACEGGGSVVEPSSESSSALALSAADAKGDYGIDLKFVTGTRRENDKFTINELGGVDAERVWRSWIVFNGAIIQDSRGEVTCLEHIDGSGARIGGVVTHSTDPSLVGATMVATVKDGFPDRSTGLRIYTSGFDAQFHCEEGYLPSQLTLNGVKTWQAIKKGFITLD
jgi:hypothetical protein